MRWRPRASNPASALHLEQAGFPRRISSRGPPSWDDFKAMVVRGLRSAGYPDAILSPNSVPIARKRERAVRCRSTYPGPEGPIRPSQRAPRRAFSPAPGCGRPRKADRNERATGRHEHAAGADTPGPSKKKGAGRSRGWRSPRPARACAPALTPAPALAPAPVSAADALRPVTRSPRGAGDAVPSCPARCRRPDTPRRPSARSRRGDYARSPLATADVLAVKGISRSSADCHRVFI